MREKIHKVIASGHKVKSGIETSSIRLGYLIMDFILSTTAFMWLVNNTNHGKKEGALFQDTFFSITNAST